MKNPFRGISSGRAEMLMLAVTLFGTYTFSSVFLFFWIRSIIPFDMVLPASISLFLLLLCFCTQNICFYNRLYREHFSGWMRHFSFGVLAFILVSGTFLLPSLFFDWGLFPGHLSGQAYGLALVICFFGLLPIPLAMKKSGRAVLYASIALLCSLVSSIFLFLCGIAVFCAFRTTIFIQERLSSEFDRSPADANYYYSVYGDYFKSPLDNIGWLAGIGILTIFALCIFHAKLIAEFTGEPLKRICSRAVLITISAAIVCHAFFLCLNWHATVQVESASRALQNRFGRALSLGGVREVYLDGKKPDKAFWDTLEKMLKLHREALFNIDHQNAFKKDEFPFNRHTKLTREGKRILDANLSAISPSLAELDRHMAGEIPKYPLEFGMQMYVDSFPQYYLMRSYCRITAWRSYMAAENGNGEEAFRLSELIRKMALFGENETFLCLIGCDVQCWCIYFDLLNILVEKHALTKNQIQMLSGEFAEWEKRIPQMEEKILYAESFLGKALVDWILAGTTKETFDGAKRTMQTWGLELFCPRFCWFLRLNQLAMLRGGNVENLDKVPHIEKIPFKPSLLLAENLICLYEKAHYEFLYLAICSRAERVILACELFRMDTGKHPTSASELVPKYMDKIPDDPFTGKPLLFRAGEIKVKAGKLEEKDNSIRIVSEPKEVEGIQVWSVGPNGKDDDGYTDYKKKWDDIRIVIQTR